MRTRPEPVPGLLNREAQRAVLGGLLGDVRSGRGRALVVRGEAGVGKSALLEYAAGAAADMRVVRGESVPAGKPGSRHHGVMTISGLGMTAKMTAAGRAQESRRPDRLFDDPLAQALAGEEGFRRMEEMRPPGTGDNPAIGPRTWFFDQLITRAAGDGFGQVVLLAAGMDTRAFRLPLPAGTVVYELDKQAVLADKQAILDREHAEPCCTRRPVAADLAGPQWPPALAATGYDPGAAAVFVAEGLTWYLPEQAIALLLDQTAAIAVPGSRLGVDMISADALANPAAAPYYALAAARGACWQFGTNDPGGLLAAHRWQADVHDMFAVARSLGRWPLPGVPDDIADRAAAASRNWLISATRIP